MTFTEATHRELTRQSGDRNVSGQSRPRLLELTAARLRVWLVMIGAALLGMHGLAMFVAHGLGYDVAMGFVPTFHFDWEGNVPTFASTLLLLFCGILASLTPSLSRADKPQTLAWRGIGAIFVLLAADEAFQIHEPLGAAVKSAMQADWMPYFAWVVPYGAVLVLLAVIYLPWFLRLGLDTQIRVSLAAILFIGGALGMEILSSGYFENLDPDREKFRTLTGDLLATVEESMELLGAGLFLHTLLRRIGGIRMNAGAIEANF